jgi:hypothetical protein
MLRSTTFFITDTFIVGVILSCIWAIAHWFHVLWGPEDPQLFGKLPLKYVFDGGELVLIVVYFVSLVRHAIAEFR